MASMNSGMPGRALAALVSKRSSRPSLRGSTRAPARIPTSVSGCTDAWTGAVARGSVRYSPRGACGAAGNGLRKGVGSHADILQGAREPRCRDGCGVVLPGGGAAGWCRAPGRGADGGCPAGPGRGGLGGFPDPPRQHALGRRGRVRRDQERALCVPHRLRTAPLVAGRPGTGAADRARRGLQPPRLCPRAAQCRHAAHPGFRGRPRVAPGTRPEGDPLRRGPRGAAAGCPLRCRIGECALRAADDPQRRAHLSAPGRGRGLRSRARRPEPGPAPARRPEQPQPLVHRQDPRTGRLPRGGRAGPGAPAPGRPGTPGLRRGALGGPLRRPGTAPGSPPGRGARGDPAAGVLRGALGGARPRFREPDSGFPAAAVRQAVHPGDVPGRLSEPHAMGLTPGRRPVHPGAGGARRGSVARPGRAARRGRPGAHGRGAPPPRRGPRPRARARHGPVVRRGPDRVRLRPRPQRPAPRGLDGPLPQLRPAPQRRAHAPL